jgi:DNA-directed RNA polymerase subunit RPC12/RpoP
MVITCSHCDEEIDVPADGDRHRCPHCKGTIVAPEPRTRRSREESAPAPNWARPLGWLATMSAVAVGVLVGGLLLWARIDTSLENRVKAGVQQALEADQSRRRP